MLNHTFESKFEAIINKKASYACKFDMINDFIDLFHKAHIMNQWTPLEYDEKFETPPLEDYHLYDMGMNSNRSLGYKLFIKFLDDNDIEYNVETQYWTSTKTTKYHIYYNPYHIIQKL
jgi:hypothetical protein